VSGIFGCKVLKQNKLAGDLAKNCLPTNDAKMHHQTMTFVDSQALIGFVLHFLVFAVHALYWFTWPHSNESNRLRIPQVVNKIKYILVIGGSPRGGMRPLAARGQVASVGRAPRCIGAPPARPSESRQEKDP
jgi:hypothetical protein